MQDISRIKISAFLVMMLALLLTGFRCTRGVSEEVTKANRPVTLKWWRVFDDEVSVRPIIESYKALHPNVTIQYRKLRFDEYEQELINALAEDRGPDILSVHNTWVQGYEGKLAPLPATVTLPFQEIVGSLKKEVVVTLKTLPTISPRALKEQFVDVVAQDVIRTSKDDKGQPREQIYGLPLALDTLVLYANRDLLNLAQIPEVPKTWTEMQSAVRKLTKLNSDGTIVQSGAALGTSRNVERATDIVALLMMQNNAQMLDISGQAAFHKTPPSLERTGIAPGEQAIVFYTDFAKPQQDVYTWSEQEPNSLEAFLSGRTAMFLGYSYHLPLIRARASRINLAVSKAPQIEGNPEVNFANYWVEGVSKKSSNQHFAWDFIQFAASAKNVGSYLTATGRPTALRSLIASQLEKEYTSVFASEILTAKSWYRGNNAKGAESALSDAIDSILAGGEPRDILNITAQRVNQTLR
ncbi:MAG: extracellular solute-binding protein [bacterium]|nr:extracellular solute-binding protein [bacterium]